MRPAWAERVVAASPVRPGDLVLDLGAGAGALTWPLLATGARGDGMASICDGALGIDAGRVVLGER